MAWNYQAAKAKTFGSTGDCRAVELFESGKEKGLPSHERLISRGAVASVSVSRDKGLEALSLSENHKSPCHFRLRKNKKMNSTQTPGAWRWTFRLSRSHLDSIPCQRSNLRKFGISYCISMLLSSWKNWLDAETSSARHSTRWRSQQKWPSGKNGGNKKADDEGRTMSLLTVRIFCCHSYAAVHTPQRETHFCESQLSQAHLSVASGISPRARFIFGIAETSHSKNARHQSRFLRRHLLLACLRMSREKFLWHGMAFVRSTGDKEVKKFLLEEANNGRLERNGIPGYSPDLNPDEGVWNIWKG